MRDEPILGLSQGVDGPRCVCGHSHELHGVTANGHPCTVFVEVDGGPLRGGYLTPCRCAHYRDASIAAGLADLGVSNAD